MDPVISFFTSEEDHFDQRFDCHDRSRRRKRRVLAKRMARKDTVVSDQTCHDEMRTKREIEEKINGERKRREKEKEKRRRA